MRSDNDDVVGLLVIGANSGAKMCVGGGVDRYNKGPESGRKLFRGFSA